MKIREFAITVLVLTAPLLAQVSNPSIRPVPTAPSGSCTVALPLELETPNGVLYSCQNGTWGQIQGSGSLPPATAAGQAPVSTGAGTNYTAQPIPSISGSVTQAEPLVGNGSGQLASSRLYLDVSQFPGTDPATKWNECNTAAITAAAAGENAICDARNLGGDQAMTATLDVGDQTVVLGKGSVTFLLPSSGVWTWALTDGTSCGIAQYDGTVLKGTKPAGYLYGLTLKPASSAVDMDSLYCTKGNPSDGGKGYYMASGFTANNSVGATFASGVVNINDVWDQGVFTFINAINLSGTAGTFQNVCCGTTLNHVNFVSGWPGQTQAGGSPLIVTGVDTDVIVENSTFNGPGVGHPNIYVDPTAGNGVFFLDDYEEKYGSDTTTAMNFITSTAANIVFEGGVLMTNCTSTCPQYAFQTESALGLSIDRVGFEFYSIDAVKDDNIGWTWESDGAIINGYHTSTDNVGQDYIESLTATRLRVPPRTVANLGSASSVPAGTMYEVSDGAGTPPTCTGGGSNYQIAISNGTSWSCH